MKRDIGLASTIPSKTAATVETSSMTLRQKQAQQVVAQLTATLAPARKVLTQSTTTWITLTTSTFFFALDSGG